MEVKLPPEIEAFVTERVSAGDFPSADALILAAIKQMQLDEDALSDETLRELEAADAEIEAGNYVEFHEFAEALRKKTGS
jgi:putative addiction module CopG family antidote